MQNSKMLIRNELLNKLKDVEGKDKLCAASNLLELCISLLDLANKIAIYNSTELEINLNFIVEFCLKEKKDLYQPFSYKNTREIIYAKYNKSFYNIFYESGFKPSFNIPWYNLDLIFIPLVAIDKFGYRLGKGGGYYDYTLSKFPQNVTKKPILCGIGFDFQLVELLPREPWDIRLDYFISDKQIIKF